MARQSTPKENAAQIQRDQSIAIETSAKPGKPAGWSDDQYHRLYHVPPAGWSDPQFPTPQ